MPPLGPLRQRRLHRGPLNSRDRDRAGTAFIWSNRGDDRPASWNRDKAGTSQLCPLARHSRLQRAGQSRVQRARDRGEKGFSEQRLRPSVCRFGTLVCMPARASFAQLTYPLEDHPIHARREPSVLQGCILESLFCDPKGSSTFLRTLSTTGGDVRLCWALLKPQGPKECKWSPSTCLHTRGLRKYHFISHNVSTK